MRLKGFLACDESQWPNDEYMKEFEIGKGYFSNEVVELWNRDMPFLHGWILKEITYSNPIDQSMINPSVILQLQDNQEECTLVFPHIFDIEVILPNRFKDYCPFCEEVQKAFISLDSGAVEFICQFTSGLKLYICAAGTSVSKV